MVGRCWLVVSGGWWLVIGGGMWVGRILACCKMGIVFALVEK